MIAVFKREFKSYFNNMLGYVVIAGTLLLIAFYFYSTNLVSGQPKFEYTLIDASGFLFTLVVPLLTMKSFAEDRRQKSDQLLLTSPLSVPQIVLGKYFGTLAVFGIAILVLIPYPLILGIMGKVNYMTAYSGLIGYFFLCAALSAIGIFMSSLTESQIISALLSLCTMLFLTMVPMIASKIPSSALVNYIIFTVIAIAIVIAIYALTRNFTVAAIFAVAAEAILIVLFRKFPAVLENSVANLLGHIAVFDQMASLAYGLFDITTLVYYISVAALFIFFTIQSIEKRRWS
ncbi:MAG: ABC transporter permease [Clostridia bacterium]|nr:ABC transporter permease [Clostridia bacterium]